MISDIPTSLLIRPLALSAVTLPLVVHNLRTGRITNGYNATLFFAGIGVLVFGPGFGMETYQPPAPWFWVLVAFGAWRIAGFGGGVKFLMVLLPWFSEEEYVFVAIAGLLVTGIVGLARKNREAQIAPTMVAMGMLVHAPGIASIMLR